MWLGWRERPLRSKFDSVLLILGEFTNVLYRARLAKIKQSEAKTLGKMGKKLGRHDHI